MVIGIYGKLCEVETGQNNIIVDIEESRGNGKFIYTMLYNTMPNVAIPPDRSRSISLQFI